MRQESRGPLRWIVPLCGVALLIAAAVSRGRWEEWLDGIVLASGRLGLGPAGGGRARGLLRLFLLIERLLSWGHDIRPLRPMGMFSYEVGPLPARRPLPLPDGSWVRHGEPVVILHLSNQAIASISRTVAGTQALTWRTVRDWRADLRVLAAMARAGAFPAGVRVVWGEGLITDVARRWGLRTRPAAGTLRTPFARFYLLTLLAIYGREGPDRLDAGRLRRHLRLGETWITLEDLQQRFGAPGPSPFSTQARVKPADVP